MPKFHFEIVDGYKIEDSVGMDCKNEEQAKKSRKILPARSQSTLAVRRPAM